MFKIKKIETENLDVKQCDFVRCGIGAKHPAKYYLTAQSGAGKTNALINFLTRFYVNRDGSSYFDDIYVFSQTDISVDPIYKKLNLDDTNFFGCNIEALRLIMNLQKNDIKKKGLLKSRKIAIVLDDFISDVKFCNQLLEIYISCRKFNCSVFTLSQAYHSLPKPSRLQQTCILFWKSSQKDIDVLNQDFCPPGHTKKKFQKVIDYCCSEKYSFIYIDLNKSIEDGRYRKELTEKVV